MAKQPSKSARADSSAGQSAAGGDIEGGSGCVSVSVILFYLFLIAAVGLDRRQNQTCAAT
jgi:hypothetical protein